MKKQLLTITLFAVSLGLQAQSTLYLNLKNNTQKQYLLTSVKSLTFPTGSLQVNKTDGSNETVVLSNLRYFNFTNGTVTGFAETEITNSSGVQLYPNPLFGGILTIRYQAMQMGLTNVEVLDINGNPVWQQQQQSQLGNNEIRIQNQRWNSGMYVCRITIGNTVEVKQLIVNNQ